MNKDKKRNDYLSWDEYFMALAKVSAGRSKDPNTQVGACIVSNDNYILSVGYNGAPIGFNDDEFPWGREGSNLETKYFYVCHAEANAIDNFRGSKKDFENAKIYTDLFPCHECAKKIVQNHIKEVIYLSDKYNGTEDNIAAKLIFDKCGIKYRRFSESSENIYRLSLKPDEPIRKIDC